MKWKPSQLEPLLGHRAKAVAAVPPVVCIYGDDAGIIRQLSQKLFKTLLTNPDDPFLSEHINAEDLLHEPSRLLDAAATIAFGGGLRVIQLHGVHAEAGKPVLTAVTQAVQACLAASLQEVVMIIPAAGIDAKSALVTAVEKSPQGAGIRCFHDNNRDLSAVITTFFAAQNQKIMPDALAFLTENLGNDREVTLRELEVLSLYAGAGQPVTLVDCHATVSSAPSLSIFKLCDAIGERNIKAVDQHLQHMQEEGEDLFGASIMVARHLKRLLKVRRLIDAGTPAEVALKSLKPPVAFGQQEFLRQAQRYPASRLQQLHKHFYRLQLESRQGLLPANAVIERLLLSLSL